MNQKKVNKLTMLGMMTALVFVSNYLRVTMPIAIGGRTSFTLANIMCCLSDLKAYLALRQDSPVYADIRENGGIGIPCFILEDGTVTRDLRAVLKP